MQIQGQEVQCLKENCSLLRAFVASKSHPILGSGVGVALWLWELVLVQHGWAVLDYEGQLYAIPDIQITCPPVLVGFGLLQGLVQVLLIRQVTETLTPMVQQFCGCAQWHICAVWSGWLVGFVSCVGCGSCVMVQTMELGLGYEHVLHFSFDWCVIPVCGNK